MSDGATYHDLFYCAALRRNQIERLSVVFSVVFWFFVMRTVRFARLRDALWLRYQNVNDLVHPVNGPEVVGDR